MFYWIKTAVCEVCRGVAKMNVDISGDQMETRLYDRDVGPDAAEAVVSKLRLQMAQEGNGTDAG